MKKKNVIIFFTDQQRFDTLGVHGNPMDLTPNLDYDAVRGTHFENAFTPQPVCLPARSCLQTGKYASETCCNTNGDSLSPDEKTLAHYFGDAGYKTGYFGKWHLNASCVGPFEKPQGGYQTWRAANIPEFVSDAYQTVVFDEKGEELKLPGYRVDAIVDEAIRYIDNNKDEPFYMMVSLLEPHMQNHRDDFPAPTGYSERYLDNWTPPDLKALGGTSASHLPGYYGMVKRIDESYGRIKDVLKSLDLLDDTIVVFTSDHGCHFKTRNNEYKRSCHDASIRIPMVWTGGQFTQGGRFPNLASLVDVPPTLLDACGIEIPEEMTGQSLLPLVERKEADLKKHAYIEISESHVGRCIRTARWKYSIRQTDNDIYVDDFLYDLQADPYELANLIGYESHQKVVDEMRSLLYSQFKEIGHDIPEIIDAPSKKSVQRKVYDYEVKL
ncbi:sulfatase-like hydrolase/transferase [Photobacterium sp. ZSDE20]|uniref:Sulfatase-like hydrolase/transferase n=1 Tax=Photobacterium pectinilyticum TaxID=2906793 RepID=A0ABT1N579_9GAMM|nr:sulfatase-like hydrolase/transferase [Photobacterium sp. ZSDE20]MCQ1059886.1 sulfatase-like hydrolase/transferase [Photobacterium sp. ZSDE20]MDD1826075.1 sulfatase-like hydrolase/transferase [Photobacterium sp. ZSDE20]